MIYPPDIQKRLAKYPQLPRDEQDLLDREIRAYLAAEMQVHGRLRPDAYPNVAPMDEATIQSFNEAFLSRRPIRRTLATVQEVAGKALTVLIVRLHASGKCLASANRHKPGR